MLWTMGRIGEIVLRIGASAVRAEERGNGTEIDAHEDYDQDNGLWRAREREYLVEMAAGLVDRCLNGGLGEHMAAVGRVVAASLSSEIVRAKYVTSFPLDRVLTVNSGKTSRVDWTYRARVETIICGF